MTDDTYSGEDAIKELTEEERENRRQALKDKVEKQRENVETAEQQIRQLRDALDEAKKARLTEKESLEQLENTTIDDFEESVDEVELARDEEDAVTVGDTDFRKESIYSEQVNKMLRAPHPL